MRHHLVAVLSVSLTGIVAHSPQASAEECTITVTESNVEVQGTDGPDVICIVGDNNTIYAGGGDDVVTDDGTGNRIYLQDGADIYDGTGGDSSFVDGGSGNDELTGTPGEDELDGGTGDDDLIGGEGIDSLNGGIGADDLQGGPGNDSLTGEVGDDTLDGGDANDTLNGGDGNDSLVGGAGGDTLNGGIGADTLAGNAGNDSLMGEVGSDNLNGGEGDDVLVGGENLDILDGGIGLNKCDYTDNEVKVSSCIYDDSPPKIESLTFTAPNWDSTSAPVDVSVNLRVTDEVGLKTGRILCRKAASGSTPEYVAMDLRIDGTRVFNVGLTATLISSTFAGSSSDAIFSTVVRVNQGTPPGQYQCFVDLIDFQNQRLFGSPNGVFSISRSDGPFDDQAPVVTLDSFSMQPVDSADTAKEVTVKLHVEDATGVHSGQFQCSMNVKGNWFEVMNLTWDLRTPAVSRTATRVDFEFRITVKKDTMPGTYTCGGHQSDVLGNHAIPWNLATFVVRNSAPEFDDDPPAIVDGLANPSSVDVGSQDQSITLSWRLTDATAIGWGYLRCWNGQTHNILDAVWGPGSIHDYWGRVLSPTITGSLQDRVFTLPLKIPFGTYPGKYKCEISASDSLQHWGSTVFAEVIVDRTPPGMPTAPTSLAFDPNPDRPSEGTLSWTTPTNLGTPKLFDYEVEVSRNGTSWTSLTDPVSGTSTRSLSNLATAANYWFRVRGDNGGNSVTGSPGATWSQPLKVTTPNPLIPSAPTDIVLSSLTSTSVSMSWSTSGYDGGSAITNFTIHLSRDAGETWNLVPRANSTSLITDVTGLVPGTEYMVRIAAINGVGASENAVTSFTTPTNPPTHPTAFEVKEVAARSLKLEWGIPTSNGGLPITDYQVEYSSNGGTTWNAISHEPSPSLIFSVTGLARATSYRFRVAAVNGNGPGAWSSVLGATTLAETSTAPGSVSITALTSNSGQVNWTSPLNNGGASITGFVVSTSRNAGETWSELSVVGSNTRSLRVSGMAPGTSYLVRVQAINGVGRSEPATTQFTTSPGVAPPPGSLKANEITTTSLNLTWDLPVSNGGRPITDYKVEVSTNGNQYRSISHTASNSLGLRISNLRSGTAYWFRVSTVTSFGTGSPSNALRIVTVGNPPSAPTSISLSARRGVYTLSWGTPATSGSSPVRNYVIEYSLDGGATWTVVNKPISTSRSLRLNGLLRQTTYNVRVSAVNDVGISQPSRVLTFTTG